MQRLFAAFDGSPTEAMHYDFGDCKASDVARFLQIYLNSLPTPLLPLTLSTGLPLPDLKEITKCLLELRQSNPTNYTMGLCLIGFLATYVDLGKRNDPTHLWVSTAAEPYSLPRVISPAPALPTLCFLVANARQILKLESKKVPPQPKWQPGSARAPSRLRSDTEVETAYQNTPEVTIRPRAVADAKTNRLKKRESSLSIFRQFSGEGWRGWRKKSEG